MRKRLTNAILFCVSAMATIDLIDIAQFKLRKDPIGTVTVHPYTVVPRNDKREELIFDAPYDETCVNSLLPHNHMSACWYLRRHAQRRMNLTPPQ